MSEPADPAAPDTENLPTDQPTVPDLPRSLADPRPVMALGTLGFLVAVVVVVVLGLTGRTGLGTALSTCLVGVALGAIGYGIFSWQRRTVRSGSGRGQQGIS
ncbi:MAG: DUF2530 domain-containing protein [Mycobacteriaceae bacterium]